MAYDAGKQYLATGYFTRALRLALAAGNRLLGGRILAAMSHQAIYLGNKCAKRSTSPRPPET
jgi:hypothetical protein